MQEQLNLTVIEPSDAGISYRELANEVWRCRDYVVQWKPEQRITDFVMGEEVVRVGDLSVGNRPNRYKIVSFKVWGMPSGYVYIQQSARHKRIIVNVVGLGKIKEHHTEGILW